MKKMICKEKNFFLCFIIFLLFSRSFAATDNKWTLSAAPFSYTQDVKRGEYEEAVLKSIPKLILEQLYGTRIRNIPDEEVLQRKINEITKARLALFLELSREEKSKDQLVIKDLSEYQFKKQLFQQEKKIEEIHRKIELNLEEQDKIIKDYKDDKGDFAPRNHFSEDFTLYKNDSNVLFDFGNDNKKINFTDYKIAKKVSDAKVNGLITGKIITYGSYAAVSVEMFLYPDGKSTGVVTEVGLLTAPETIAKNIAWRLAPKIENSIPCDVQIIVKPEGLENARLTVDSTVYTHIPEKMIISNGVHNLTFECDGYRKESFSYGFGYEKKYLIEIEFVKDEPIETALVLKKNIEGNLFYNGVKAQDNVMSVKINNRGVLGYYLTENDNTLFFMIPYNQIVDDKAVVAKLNDIDIGANIEKRRKMMYISYSTLVCTLPFLLYSYSNYTNLVRANQLGYSTVDIQKAQTYQTMSFIGIGLSVGAGIWFVTELVRYLVSANKALPVETKRSNIEFENAVTDYKTVQEELKASRLEKEKAEQEAEEKRKAAEEESEAESENIEKTAEENPSDINTDNEIKE